MSETAELKNRVEAKRHEIEAEIARLKADAEQDHRERIERLESRIQRLGDSLEDGWKNLSDSVVNKLNDWLKDSDES